MTKTRKTYDPRCEELAALFLGDEPSIHTPEKIEELATLIQSTIEDFITYERVEIDKLPLMENQP